MRGGERSKSGNCQRQTAHDNANGPAGAGCLHAGFSGDFMTTETMDTQTHQEPTQNKMDIRGQSPRHVLQDEHQSRVRSRTRKGTSQAEATATQRGSKQTDWTTQAALITNRRKTTIASSRYETATGTPRTAYEGQCSNVNTMTLCRKTATYTSNSRTRRKCSAWQRN